MKDKISILHERALMTCVVMLFVCIIFKLFGVQWFNLDTNIPVLQEIDKIIMSSVPLSFLYSLILKSINEYLICIIVLKSRKIDLFKLLAIVILSMVIKRVLNYNLLSVFIDFNILLLFCLHYNNKCFKEYYLAMTLNLVYQIISLFIRSISLKCGYYSLIESIILNLDYYLMHVITYLYLMKGGQTLCGMIHAFYSSLRKMLLKKPLKECSENKE